MQKKFYLFVSGCQMNLNDAERLRHLLKEIGLKETQEEKKADLILALLCSVRQTPIDRVWGKLKIWEKLKKKPKIIFSGCITKSDKKKFAKRVDLIFDILDIKKLLNFLIKIKIAAGEQNKNLAQAKKDFFTIKPLRFEKEKAYIALGTGCNNFCTYCVVPYTRGKEIYRPLKQIEQEFKEAIKNGAKTISLIAQNVNSYRLDEKSKKFLAKKYGKKTDFALLLTFLNDIKKDLPGKWKIEFLTSHPKDMDNDLIKAVANLKKISKWIHLPVQSGDEKILQNMNRQYSRKKYINLVKKIRKSIPNVLLTTDIIVGFPDESKKQFAKTVSLCKICKFDQAFIAKYSPRPNTLAMKFKDNVPLKEKKRRFRILDKLINKKMGKKQNPWQITKK